MKRIELRPLQDSDAGFVESLYADAQVTQTLLQIQRPLTHAEAVEFCRTSAPGDHRFVAEHLTEGELIAIGTVRVHDQTATIGYAVVPAFWGQGFGTELAGLLVRFALDTAGAEQVRATTLDDNIASARVLEKLGFDVLLAGTTEVDARGVERRVTVWSLR